MRVSRKKKRCALLPKRKSAGYLAENTGYVYKIFILDNRHQASDKPSPAFTIYCHALYNIKKNSDHITLQLQRQLVPNHMLILYKSFKEWLAEWTTYLRCIVSLSKMLLVHVYTIKPQTRELKGWAFVEGIYVLFKCSRFFIHLWMWSSLKLYLFFFFL